ncbi:MAG: hypothetical protein PHU49_01230 [Syntrophorhabdaceae bacterium]|nr:hypothetical protein [Syntrophorhabdaceae bacterium]MDD5242613.1 hypothetical protein [Syntrophorhabdaceae bacterium]
MKKGFFYRLVRQPIAEGDRVRQDGYELRFPFRPTHPFSDVEGGVAFQCGELTVRLTWSPPEAILRIGPFPTHEDAETFLPRVWGALAWAAITRGTGFTAEMTWSHLTFPADPLQAAANVAKSFGMPEPTEPLHALGDGGHPCVIPTGKNYCLVGMGDARATVSESYALFGAPFVQALSTAQAEKLYLDERLRTAVQLLSDSHREVSGRSRFLTYIIALEVLTEPQQKHPIALRLLDAFNATLVHEESSHDVDTDEWHAIESLRREVVFRRETSLRSRIRRLVLDALDNLPYEECRQRAREAVWAYDQRSALVHDGSLPRKALDKAAGIARRTLLDVLRQRVGLPVLQPAA